MQIFQIIFWVSLLTLLFTYFGYPLTLWTISQIKRKVRHKSNNDSEKLPFISLLIPAYNEESVIRQKITNSLDQDYPDHRMEIVVASDGSDDKTNNMLKAFGNSEIRSIKYRKRTGKTDLINRTIPKLKGDIVIFSDASAMLDSNAVSQIVERFSHPEVGCVSGTYIIENGDETNRGRGEGLYFKYETSMKSMESEISSILGAHGSLYAIRKELFIPLASNIINDDYIIPMQVVDQGYRSVYEKSAVAREVASTDVSGEMKRRIRINAGNFQQIKVLKRMLNPMKTGTVAYQFFSHKLLRLMSPILMLTTLLSSIMVPSLFFNIMVILQIVFYLFGIANYFLERKNIKIKILAIPFYFVMGALTTFKGFTKYLELQPEGKSNLWERTDTIKTS